MYIKSLTLLSSDLDAQLEFYSHKMGFEVKAINEKELIISAGRTELVFRKSVSQPFYHYCFLVPANKLEEALEWAQARMELIETEDGFRVESNSSWKAHSFYFLDGNGNIAEFISHYNLDNHSDELFSAQSIISINEIGCPSNDIPKLSSWIEENVGSKFWTGNTTRFGTNGDENGCFLLVNNEDKKTWYPTDKFSESASFEAEIEEDKSVTKLAFSAEGFGLI